MQLLKKNALIFQYYIELYIVNWKIKIKKKVIIQMNQAIIL